jgi:hypothetical protein
MTRVHRRPKQRRKVNKMKNQNTVFITIVSALAFALAPVTKAARNPEGGPDPISLAISATVPVITVHSTDNVTRGKTGSFVLVGALGKTAEENMKPALMFGGMYVNFKVSGTAIAGVDYVLLVSPAYIGRSGYGVIQVKTLPDPRGSAFREAYSVTVTLEPGAGYGVGAARSATMWIKPALQSSNQSSN